MGVLRGAKPRSEVLKGDLTDTIFAADFGDLIEGDAPPVYGSPAVFFQNTHPAAGLRNVVETVFARLADTKEPGATMRLSTGFGGGKTHTLMALWHLANNIADVALGTELLPAAGRPKSVTVVGIDAGEPGVPQFAAHGALKVHSLWGEMFYRLGGEKALKALGRADDCESSPSEDQIQKAFPKGPVLLLFDELVIYMARLSDPGQGNLLGFLNSLASVVSKRPQTVLVLTDPAQQAAYAAATANLASVQAAALKLSEVQSRKVSDFDPIRNEAARIIVRRLFERVDPAAAQAASAAYHTLYERLAQEQQTAEFKAAATPNYAQRIVECYPFHPRLLDTAQDRLAAMHDFQQSRGVLRLFARIIRDVWERGDDEDLITAGEIDWSSQRIRADLLERLQRDRFKAAVSADVEKHAAELDGGEQRGIHTRVASALLLESLPLQSSSGLDKPDSTLAVLRPEEAGPEPGDALDRLCGVCWHTYPMEGGRGVQFRYEPNVIKQIEQRMRDVLIEDARSHVLADAQAYFGGPTFALAAWPDSASQAPESAELQLALCETAAIAERVCKYSDDSNPQAPMPRKFRNAIVAVAPTAPKLNEAIASAQRLMAAEKIEQENRTGDAAKLVRDQLQRIKPQMQKQFHLQARRAFDQLFLATGPRGPLDEKYQVSEEEVLKQPQGQACIRRFLDDKNLVYKPGTALDVKLFLDKILPGAVPEPGKPDVYSAKAIHERFLATDGLRLLRDGDVVRLTILKALAEGKVVVHLSDGRAYDDNGYVEGPAGRRRRVVAPLTALTLSDAVLVTRSDTETAKAWLKEDKPKKDESRKEEQEDLELAPPPPPDKSSANNWEQVVKISGEQPVADLRLSAHTPADAAALAGVAQPLGADALALDITVGGDLRDGGNINFAVRGMRPSHPAKPLQIAQTIFNSLVEGATYDVHLALKFGAAGRADLAPLLEQMRASAPDGVEIYARFARSAGAKA